METPRDITSVVKNLLYESNIPPDHEVARAFLIAVEALEEIENDDEENLNHGDMRLTAENALSRIRCLSPKLPSPAAS